MDHGIIIISRSIFIIPDTGVGKVNLLVVVPKMHKQINKGDVNIIETCMFNINITYYIRLSQIGYGQLFSLCDISRFTSKTPFISVMVRYIKLHIS